MKYFKKLFVSFIIVGFLIGLAPKDAFAQSADCPFPGCYGGYALPYTMTCTCSYYYSWTPYFPFYQYGIPSVMASYMAVPLVVDFMEYFTSPAQSQLGTDMMGMQGCEMYYVYGCFPMPVFGTIMEYTGVSPTGPYVY